MPTEGNGVSFKDCSSYVVQERSDRAAGVDATELAKTEWNGTDNDRRCRIIADARRKVRPQSRDNACFEHRPLFFTCRGFAMQQLLLDLIIIFPVLFMIYAIVLVEFGDPEMRKSAQEYQKHHGRGHMFSSF